MPVGKGRSPILEPHKAQPPQRTAPDCPTLEVRRGPPCPPTVPPAPSIAPTPAACWWKWPAAAPWRCKGDPGAPAQPGHPLPEDDPVPGHGALPAPAHHPPAGQPAPRAAGAFSAHPLGRGPRSASPNAGGRSSPSHGAEAILPYSYAGTMGLIQRNAGHPFFHRLGASRLDRTICTPAKAAGWAAVMGQTPALPPDTVRHKRPGAALGHQRPGHQPAHPEVGARGPARRGQGPGSSTPTRPPPRQWPTAPSWCAPAATAPWPWASCTCWCGTGCQDQAFIDAHVQGFPELAARVLPDYPPERVAALTGLAAAGAGGAGRGLRPGPGALHPAGQRALPLRQRRHEHPRHRLPPGGGGRLGPGWRRRLRLRRQRRRFPDLGEVTREDFLPAPHAHRQHEPPGPRPGAPGQAPGHGPLRLPLQPRRGDPGPERGAARARPHRPVHRGARALPHRHGPLRRPGAAGHLLPGAQRPLPVLRQLLRPAGPRRHPAGGGKPLQLGRVPGARRGHGLHRAVLPAGAPTT